VQSHYIEWRIVNLDRVMKEKIWAQNKEFASRALRVLGFAYKRYLGDEDSNPI
jgi:magnesium-transporting ATPase (P-type)